MLKAGIVIDAWKLPIFERLLSQSGYTYTNAGKIVAGALALTVETDNVEALYEVIKAANTEAAEQGVRQ